MNPRNVAAIVGIAAFAAAAPAAAQVPSAVTLPQCPASPIGGKLTLNGLAVYTPSSDYSLDDSYRSCADGVYSAGALLMSRPLSPGAYTFSAGRLLVSVWIRKLCIRHCREWPRDRAARPFRRRERGRRSQRPAGPLVGRPRAEWLGPRHRAAGRPHLRRALRVSGRRKTHLGRDARRNVGRHPYGLQRDFVWGDRLVLLAIRRLPPASASLRHGEAHLPGQRCGDVRLHHRHRHRKQEHRAGQMGFTFYGPDVAWMTFTVDGQSGRAYLYKQPF